MSQVRVRFAPSPTGGLHLGGVRTALYNYLFAKNKGGKFIVRIEDTDQTRFVEGAEEYIFNCLKWCGIEPDESPVHGGPHGPYRQSERKESGLYRQYAEELVSKGYAYYAFDTAEELENMRQENKSAQNPSPQYDHHLRMKMRNSLTLPEDEVKSLIAAGTAHVIRIKMPENETIVFQDMIRGEIKNLSGLVDDKVLLKADGMPTYHLAVVVDDHLMEISHAFRGEEWLPSAPVHVLLWKYLFGLDKMPQWAHFPLILGPNGKLSKRDGAKYGFPVFAMNWMDPKTNELTEGFKEKGFLPEAFINLLALLGWHGGTEQELYTKTELTELFSIERVHSGGAKFDYEKARWFNHEWIKRLTVDGLRLKVGDIFESQGITGIEEGKLDKVIELVKDRCTLLSDFWEQGHFFFKAPTVYDVEAVKPKWDQAKVDYFNALISKFKEQTTWSAADMEVHFKELATAMNIKAGELQMILRVMLVGSRMGPGVFLIAETIGREDTIKRISDAMPVFLA